MSNLAIDASTAAKWQLSEEPEAERARYMLRDYAAAKVTFVAPTIWHMAHQSGRCSEHLCIFFQDSKVQECRYTVLRRAAKLFSPGYREQAPRHAPLPSP